MKNVNHTNNVNANGVHESHLAKKNDLKIQKNSFLRFSVSLALSLFMVYTIFQVETASDIPVKDEIAEVLEDDLTYVPVFKEEVIQVKEIKPEPEVKTTLITDVIKQVDDDYKDIKNTVLTTESKPKETTKVVATNNVEVIDEGTGEIEEIPFVFVEDAPVFPGCEKYTSKEERKKCMSEKIQKHVTKKFDTSLADDLGLDEGIKRINVLFIIDENGNVTGIQSRGPHPKLEKEAERVINMLPKMEPAKQRTNKVRVKYTLPIIFRVN